MTDLCGQPRLPVDDLDCAAFIANRKDALVDFVEGGNQSRYILWAVEARFGERGFQLPDLREIPGLGKVFDGVVAAAFAQAAPECFKTAGELGEERVDLVEIEAVRNRHQRRRLLSDDIGVLHARG